MGETPVTQEQFALWKPDHANDSSGKPLHPAEQVTWHGAVAYCRWLTGEMRRRLPEGYVAGLPSEAHWEYACRAGTDTEYHTGDGEAALGAAGWYEGNSDYETHPVKSKQPNASGLYDMHGHVYEWCSDVWDENAYRKRVDAWNARVWELRDAGEDATYFDDDARGLGDPARVVRGGSFGLLSVRCRSAFRVWDWSD